MESFRYLNKFLILCFLLSSCADLEKIQESILVQEPLIHSEEISGEKNRGLSRDDCRLSTYRNEKISIYIEKLEYPGGIENTWKELFRDFQNEIFGKENTKVVYGDFKKEEDSFRKLCMESGIDIAIHTVFELKSDEIIIKQKFNDSYLDISYGEIEYSISKFLYDDSQSITNEFYYDSLNFFPIKKFAPPQLKFIRRPKMEKINSIIKKNLSSIINFYSIDTETELLVNRIPVGKLPMEGYRMNRGMHEVQFKKRGRMSPIFLISLRGGEIKNFINPLESVLQSTSLYLWSEPQNLNIYRDGILVGETPYLFSQITSGEKNISIKTNTPDKIYIKNGTKNIYIYPERLESSEKLAGIFQNLSSYIIPQYEDGIAFLNDSGEFLDTWVGIRSHLFIEGNYLLKGEIVPFPERGMGEILIMISNYNTSKGFFFNEDKIAFIDFSNNQETNYFRVKSNSTFIKININSKKKKVIYKINESQVGSMQFERFGEMRFHILVKGNVFNRINIFKNFSIQRD